MSYAGRCTLCRNHCPLDNPNCPDVVTGELKERMMARNDKTQSRCALCEKHCLYTALGCETGITMARITGKLPREVGEKM